MGRYALLPAVLANPGDYILLRNIPSSVYNPVGISHIRHLPFYPLMDQRGVIPVNYKEVSSALSSGAQLIPWGWSRSLVAELTKNGTDISLLPSMTELRKFRNLAHRKTGISFLSLQDAELDHIIVPCEVSDLRSALSKIRDYGVACLKLPWSSSGRGIVFSNQLDARHLNGWIEGGIRQQGSVIIEKAYRRQLDFASEWMINEGTIEFLGYSLFEVSGRGKYTSNVLIDPQRLASRLENLIPTLPLWIERQRHFISTHIAPSYSGPLGFDMFLTNDGILNPCVEINLRRTMGHVALEISRIMVSDPYSEISSYFQNLFPDNRFILS